MQLILSSSKCLAIVRYWQWQEIKLQTSAMTFAECIPLNFSSLCSDHSGVWVSVVSCHRLYMGHACYHFYGKSNQFMCCILLWKLGWESMSPVHLKALQHLMHVIYFLTHPAGYSVQRGADKALAWPTSWCHRTESIVSLERGVCSCAELQVFSC